MDVNTMKSNGEKMTVVTSPNRSSDCTRRRSSGSKAHGGTGSKWSWRLWTGWTRSTTEGCSSRSGISRQPSTKRRNTAARESRPKWWDSHNRVSGRAGAVHNGTSRVLGPGACPGRYPGLTARKHVVQPLSRIGSAGLSDKGPNSRYSANVAGSVGSIWRAGLFLLVSSFLLGCSGHTNQTPELATEELRSEWLVPPKPQGESDWRLLNRPRGIVTTPHGDLVVSDTGNSRLVRLSPEGRLIHTIGREGNGPGEFLEPAELGFQPGSDILWILDRRKLRVLRFHVSIDTSTYIDEFSAPQALGAHVQLLSVKDGDSFWFNSLVLNERIALIDDKSRAKQTFGPYYPFNSNSFTINDSNAGFVFYSTAGYVYFIGKYIPVIEKWKTTGTQVRTVNIGFPDVVERQEKGPSSDRSRIKYIDGVCYQQEIGIIYVLVQQWGESRTRIYEVSDDDLSTLGFYEFDDLDSPFYSSLTVLLDGGRTEFFCLDANAGIKKVFSP